MNILAQPPVAPEASPRWGTEQRLLLHNVSWESYVAIGEALRERANIRMTYDQGDLEIMTLSSEHESYKHIFVILMSILAQELRVPMRGLASTTMRREDIERGLEPDECYWIRNEQRVRGIKRLDLSVDPPPDLVIEIDITRTSTRRIKIYSVLGVAEVWCYDGEKMTLYQLDASGNYRVSDRSDIFPQLPIGNLAGFVALSDTTDELSLMDSFRAWVREQLGTK